MACDGPPISRCPRREHGTSIVASFSIDARGSRRQPNHAATNCSYAAAASRAPAPPSCQQHRRRAVCPGHGSPSHRTSANPDLERDAWDVGEAQLSAIGACGNPAPKPSRPRRSATRLLVARSSAWPCIMAYTMRPRGRAEIRVVTRRRPRRSLTTTALTAATLSTSSGTRVSAAALPTPIYHDTTT